MSEELQGCLLELPRREGVNAGDGGQYDKRLSVQWRPRLLPLKNKGEGRRTVNSSRAVNTPTVRPPRIVVVVDVAVRAGVVVLKRWS